MKEFIIKLPAMKEYTYIVQNKNTNCVFIRNYNPSVVTAGTKPYPHDTIIPPFRTGVISRPFPLDYIFLQANKETPVEIFEAYSKNSVDNLVQQEIAKTINIKLEEIESINISRDKKNNINVLIQNTPRISQKSFKIISKGPTHGVEIEFDTRYNEKPIFNIIPRPLSYYDVFFYNEWLDCIYVPRIFFPPYRQIAITRNNPILNITDNTFRFIRIRGRYIRFPFRVIISATR